MEYLTHSTRTYKKFYSFLFKWKTVSG